MVKRFRRNICYLGKLDNDRIMFLSINGLSDTNISEYSYGLYTYYTSDNILEKLSNLVEG